MQASIGPCRPVVAAPRAVRPVSSPFCGSTAALQSRPLLAAPRSRAVLQVRSAITREKKEQVVSKLKEHMEGSAVVFGMRFKGITVKQMEQLRRSLPKESKIYVAKNSLMRAAVDQTEGWTDMTGNCNGDNAWWFVPEDVIGESVKAFLAFEKELQDKLPKEEKGKEVLQISGGAMSGKPLDMAALKALEKLPTKKELIATIARLIKQVPTKLAVSIKQVPTKVALGIKALADGDDNKELLVGDVFPKAPAAEAAAAE